MNTAPQDISCDLIDIEAISHHLFWIRARIQGEYDAVEAVWGEEVVPLTGSAATNDEIVGNVFVQTPLIAGCEGIFELRARRGDYVAVARRMVIGDMIRDGLYSPHKVATPPFLIRRRVWPDDLDDHKVSVVLAVYNGAQWLAQAIDSVLAQTFPDVEFIVVDDGSTDGTPGILAEYADRYPTRMTVVTMAQNLGQAAAFNAGIVRAKGGLTCFLDADDFFYPDKVARMHATYMSTKGSYSFYQHNLCVYRDNQQSNENFRAALLSGDILNDTLKEGKGVPGPFVPTSGLCVPTEVLRAIYPLPPKFRICADGFLTRAAIAFGPVHTTPASLGGYRIHEANHTAENPTFNTRRYTDELLVPEMNRFYRAHQVPCRLPVFTKKPPQRLRSVVPRRHREGVLYETPPALDFLDISEIRDRHRGQRGFIVATGPSLRIEDLDCLKNEITFSCNKIYLAFSKTAWRPTYYSIIDTLVHQNFSHDLNAIPSIKLFPTDFKKRWQGAERSYFVRQRRPIYHNGERQFEFSTDLSEGMAGGFTVVYTLMQFAYHLGIRELYLLGLDFSFDYTAPTGGTTSAGEPIIVNRNEVNHFHPDYRKPGEEWSVPRLDLQRRAFLEAKKAFEAAGGSIINLSRQTALDVFERGTLEDVLNRNSAPPLPLPLEVPGAVEKAEIDVTRGTMAVSGWTAPPPKRVSLSWKGGCGDAGLRPEKAGLGIDAAAWRFDGQAGQEAGSSAGGGYYMEFDFGSRSERVPLDDFTYLFAEENQGTVTMKSRGRTALVTGGLGFLGRRLCARLLAKGFQVVCLDNCHDNRPEIAADMRDHPRFHLVQHDISTPLFLDEVDQIYHLACPSPKGWAVEPSRLVRTNVHGAINLMGLARHAGAKVLLASIAELAGEGADLWWKNESYLVSKRCAETVLLDHHRQYGQSVKILRLPELYGPGMPVEQGRLVAGLIDGALNGKPVDLAGNGQRLRYLCHVDDAVDAMIRLMATDDRVTGPITLTPGQGIPEAELAAIVRQLANSAGASRQDNRGDLPGRVPMAASEVEWLTTISLSDGLASTLAAMGETK